jgi:hypothetical protein
LNVLVYTASTVILWASKTVLYHYAFRWRHIRATIQTKLIVAAAPLLVRGVLPFSLTGVFSLVVGIGVGIYLCKQFTNGKLYPDIVLIVTGIEIVAVAIIARLLTIILF